MYLFTCLKTELHSPHFMFSMIPENCSASSFMKCRQQCCCNLCKLSRFSLQTWQTSSKLHCNIFSALASGDSSSEILFFGLLLVLVGDGEGEGEKMDLFFLDFL